jgi:hypothetical protein
MRRTLSIGHCNFYSKPGALIAIHKERDTPAAEENARQATEAAEDARATARTVSARRNSR